MDDSMSSCRKMEVVGVGAGKTLKECVNDDMKVLGLQPEWAIFRDMWMDFIWANV